MLARSKEDLYAIVRNNKQILLWARPALWLFLSLLAGHVRVNTLHFPGLFPSLSPQKHAWRPSLQQQGSGRARGALGAQGRPSRRSKKWDRPKLSVTNSSSSIPFEVRVHGPTGKNKFRVNPRPIFFTCILPTALMYLGWFVATKYQHMRLIKLKKKQILRLMGD